MYSFLSFPLTLRTMLSNFGAPSSVTYPMGLVVFSVLSPDDACFSVMHVVLSSVRVMSMLKYRYYV